MATQEFPQIHGLLADELERMESQAFASRRSRGMNQEVARNE